MWYKLIRPLLFSLPPEVAHAVTLKTLQLLQPILPIQRFSKPVTVMGLHFPNPIGLAAGLDKNGEYVDALAKLGFGFIEVGTLTPRPQMGNPKPRLFRIPNDQALINRMGFNNHGIDRAVQRIKQRQWPGVLGINIGKNKDTHEMHTIEDYLIAFKKAYEVADYITVNISSPNTPGLRDWQQADSLKQLIEALQIARTELLQAGARYKPLAVKVAPDLKDDAIAWIADTLLTCRIDGLIATNTTTKRDGIRDLKLVPEAGGLSGKPLTHLSTLVIKKFYQHLNNQIPIIAVGGILSAQDAQEKLDAGAQLIQLYTGLIYRGPYLIRQIFEECFKNKRY